MSPLIQWAHQGGAKEEPSNTLRAMRAAIALADGRPEFGLECDVHLSTDGKLVIIHDKTLERTTNGRGRVAQQPYLPVGPSGVGIQTAHAAWWWREGVVDDHTRGPYPLRDETADGLRVPTIEEILDLAGRGKLTIEIKSKAAARELARSLLAREPTEEGLVVTSFSSRNLRRFRRAMGKENVSQVELAPGLAYMLWFKLRIALGLPPRKTIYARVQIPVRKLKMAWATPRFVKAAHGVQVKNGGLENGTAQTVKVDVWTIDDEATMHGLRDLGVDGIMTDTPKLLDNVVAAYPLWL